jgi:hypothetical protein
MDNMGLKPRLVARLSAVIVCSFVGGAFPSKAAYYSVFPLHGVAGVPEIPRELEPVSAKARPGYLAELEELETARKAGTVAAYDMFLARHPNSRYAPQARKERALILAR